MVVYHASCVDGMTAAWIMSKVGVGGEYIPAHYGDGTFEKVLKSSERKIWIVDFSFKRSEIEQLVAAGKSVVVYDHHKTAALELQGGVNGAKIVFDMSKCGSMICLDQHNNGWGDLVREIVTYVQDRDLWQWKLRKSREVSSAISTFPMTLESWNNLMNTDIETLMKSGKAILAYQKTVIDSSVSHAVEHRWDLNELGLFVVPVLNLTTLISEVGEALCKKYPVSLSYFRRKDGKWVYSLRTDGTVDVSLIAQKYGGGGHKAAAGFVSDTLIF